MRKMLKVGTEISITLVFEGESHFVTIERKIAFPLEHSLCSCLLQASSQVSK